MKTALITGITGQVGSYLAEFLLQKGYKVYGLIRRTSAPNFSRIKQILDKIELISGDILDQKSLIEAVLQSRPDEVYHFAAQSTAGEVAWKTAEFTGNVNGLGALRMIEAVKLGCEVLGKQIRYYQTSSAAIFDPAYAGKQNEKTPLAATTNPYDTAKLYAHYTAIMYRKKYGMFAVNGLTFSHESPRRGVEFVTKKISMEVAKIALGLSSELLIGNLDGRRDWGFVGDYVEAMWLSLQQDKPDDYVIATGELRSVREFIEEAFNFVGLDWTKYVKQDPKFIRRSADEAPSCGDSTKAREILGWKPKVTFKELVRMMVKHDLEELKNSGQKEAEKIAEQKIDRIKEILVKD